MHNRSARVRVVAVRNREATGYLKNVSFKIVPGRKIRAIAKDRKTAEYFKDFSFIAGSNGVVRVVAKRRKNHV